MRRAPKLFLLCLLAFLTANAQDSKPQTSPKKPIANADADREQRARRAQARSLLIALSTDARTFKDSALRARSLARIADALWQVDPEQGRVLFRKAWDAAEAADAENDVKLQEEINRQKSRTGGGFALDLPPNLRKEVLSLTARHDHALGEEFLEKFKTQKEDAATSTARNLGNRSDSLEQRLSLALELLNSGDTEQAILFAEPALTTINRATINFLSYLREKAPAAADQRYAALLNATANNLQVDANTISLLSSYIFTPHLFVTFSRGGASTSQMSQLTGPIDVSPELRNLFFRVASTVLLRPQPTPEQEGPGSADSRYLVTRRLLPLFEQYGMTEMADALRSQINSLSTLISDNARRNDDEWVNKGIKPDAPAEDMEQKLLDKIDRAKTSSERDDLYIQLAYRATNRVDRKARDYAAKVEDPELRKTLQAYTDASLTLNAVRKKQTDLALEIARKGDLTHVQRAWALAECAKLLIKTNRQQALDIIDEAADEAHRIDVSDPYLPRTLLQIANVLNILDPPRVWDATFDAVKAANSAEGFTGEDGALALTFQSKGYSSVHSNDVADFDVAGLFSSLARIDFDRSVELARGFKGEGPRAVATIAIARAILNKKN